MKFLPVWFYELKKEEGYISCYLSEKQLDESCFKKLNDNSGGILDRTLNKCSSLIDIPQAFSHWTYVETKEDLLICNLQGVQDKEVFLMTNPAIHTKRGIYFGPKDNGGKG